MRINTIVIMADENKTILIKVELDVAQLKKASTEAAVKLEELKIKQSLLKAQNQQGTVEYAKLSNEIRKTNKVLQDNAKALEINDRLSKTNTGSINDMRDQLAAATVAYNSMSKEQRESSQEGQKLQEEIKGISDALKGQEGAIGDNRRNVGNYAGALQELKAELKSLKGEMVGLDADSERYQELTARAGELGDKIKEVNENVKASSGGTGFEKLSNNLGLVKDDLMNLDFAGVSEKMSQMAKISQAMTFSEVLGGLKNMGSALLSLGKAILVNPLFLLGAVIIGVGKALMDWSAKTDQEAVAAQNRLTLSLERQTDALAKQAQSIRDNGELRLRMAAANGASEAELHRIRLQTIDQANAKEQDQLDALNKEMINLRNEYHKQVAILDEWWGSQAEEDEAKRRATEAKEALNGKKKEYESLKYQLQQAGKERNVIDAEFKSSQSASEIAAAENTKAINKAKNDALLQQQKDLAAKLRDLLLSNNEQTIENERAALEAKYTFLEKENEGFNDILVQLAVEKAAEVSSIEEREKQAAIDRVVSRYETELSEAKNNKALITELKRERDLEIAAIEIESEAAKKLRDQDLEKRQKDLEKERVNSAKRIAQEIELIDAELALSKSKGTDSELQAWQALQDEKIQSIETLRDIELSNAQLTADEKVKIAKQAELDIQGIKTETFSKEKTATTEQTEWTKEEKKSMALAAVGAAQQLSDTLFQVAQNGIQRELNAEKEKYDESSSLLQNQLDAGIISQADYNAQKSALDAEYQAKEKALKEEAFKKNKAAQLINAAIATAVGVANALAAPPPTGLIMAGIAGALGLAQVGVIASQPTPTFAKGGIFGGQPHSSGGTKGYFSDGTKVEVEKDELFVVVNKKSTGMLSKLSSLNEMGGGVPFMAKGGALTFASGGAFASQAGSNVDNQFNMQNVIIQTVKNMPQPVVLVEDINTAQGNLSDVSSRANF